MNRRWVLLAAGALIVAAAGAVWWATGGFPLGAVSREVAG